MSSKNLGAEYREVWGNADFTAVTQEEREKRHGEVQKIADAYFDLTNDNYEDGWGEKLHFSRFQHGESIEAGLTRHEHYMALMGGFKPGMKILDAGCGFGSPAKSIASFIGAHVTGITINRAQVLKARAYAEEEGLSHLVDFVEGDFNKMPFTDNTFDAVFAIEATCYGTTLETVYREIRRVLKPGGSFVTYEWLMTPKYNDDNPVHRQIRNRIERGSGVPNLTNAKNAIKSLDAAGLVLEREEDLAIPTAANPVDWWYPLDGNLKYATHGRDRWKVFMLKKWVYLIVLTLLTILEFLHIARQGRVEAIKTMAQEVYGLRDGGREGIFTPMHMFVARKPKK